MHRDYGHPEEGEPGKVHNLTLLKRLAHYAFPYKKSILKALLITVLITFVDLTVPYLSKIAIDRYILSSWYRVDTSGSIDLNSRDLRNKYGHLLEKTEDGSLFISHMNMKKIDPLDLHIYQSRHIITPERFYRTSSGTQADVKGLGEIAFSDMNDDSMMIPYQTLKRLPRERILIIRDRDVKGVAKIAFIFIFFIIASLGLSYVQYYLLEFTGQHIMQDIRLRLFQRVQSQSMRFFDRHPVGRLVTRMTNDIENLNEMVKSVFIAIFKDIFLLSGILIVLLFLNWRLALISFVLLPFIFGLTLLFSSMSREAFRELRSAVARINIFLQERISGMRVIQAFVKEKFQAEAFVQTNHENYLAGMKQIRIFAMFMPIMELFSALAVALLIWHGGGKVIAEQLTLGSLVAFISYMQMFFKPIRDISEKFNIMQSAMASTERIFEFMDLQEEIPEAKYPVAPSEMKGHIMFDHVSFAYKKGTTVLKDISFEVNPGETIAVVGATGSGKTTLVNLVERFYDPDKGKVVLDGIDLRDWPKGLLHENIGLCMQDVFNFTGGLGDNISLGREGVGGDAVEQAAKTANALSIIKRLERGFQHEIGEGGVTLSAGERQLLSFARALAGNPRVLILDEATSSIDPETEHLIQQAIQRMRKKRTTMIVAHRLSTIREADRILVMHKGQIREDGTHDELMVLRGIYYRLNQLREESQQEGAKEKRPTF